MMKWLVLTLSGLYLCLADLRMASQPKKGFKVRNMGRRRVIKFNATFALYMEPSDFNYAGLKKQRDGGGYDNFLRSNIDNQQDRRNFNTEDGKDHLPFRTYETTPTDVGIASQKNKIPTAFPGPAITVAPGVAQLVPLRWNNPHAAELEINIWIMRANNAALAKPFVVPILKPTCSGEGYQDQAFTFTVPTDFNNVCGKIPGFQGCKAVGDCVLQQYAHSVESRQYAHGVPLIVTGACNGNTNNENQIKKLTHISMQDPGLDLTTLRTLCLARSDPAARITTSLPQEARLISDVYNHAYQNSDYSPYSGQQPKEISKNMQASCVLKMIPANRGELGKQALLRDNRKGFKFARQLDRKAKQLVKQYERIANSIINMIDKKEKNTDLMGPATTIGKDAVGAAAAQTGTAAEKTASMVMQQANNCFRCNEVGSVITKRKETNTYIPSYQIQDNTLLAAVKVLASDEYSKVLSDTGLVQIYVPAMNDLMGEFEKAYALNITYQGPMLKDTMNTMADGTKFKKLDATGAVDKEKGAYAARQAYKLHGYVGQSEGTRPFLTLPSANPTPLAASMATDCALGSACTMPILVSGVGTIADELDMHGVMADADCDDPDAANVDEMECTTPKMLFDLPTDLEAETFGTAGVVTANAFGTSFTAVFLLALLGLLSLQ